MSRAFVQEKDVDYLEALPEPTDLQTSERRHRDGPDAKRTCSRCVKRWPIARDEIFATGLPGARRRGSYRATRLGRVRRRVAS